MSANHSSLELQKSIISITGKLRVALEWEWAYECCAKGLKHTGTRLQGHGKDTSEISLFIVHTVGRGEKSFILGFIYSQE